MEKIRAFIALELLPPLQNDLFNLIGRLKRVFPQSIRWVQSKNIHLTLKFLGDIPHSYLDPLSRGLNSIFDGCPPVPLRFTGLGVFPSSRNPRVFWVGIENVSLLEQKVTEIEELSASLKIPSENRSFAPHLTLGRANGDGKFENHMQIDHLLASVKCDLPDNAYSDRVTVFQSELTRQGPIYTPLARFQLKNQE